MVDADKFIPQSILIQRLSYFAKIRAYLSLMLVCSRNKFGVANSRKNKLMSFTGIA
jgi:hypothetical protein